MQISKTNNLPRSTGHFAAAARLPLRCLLLRHRSYLHARSLSYLYISGWTLRRGGSTEALSAAVVRWRIVVPSLQVQNAVEPAGRDTRLIGVVQSTALNHYSSLRSVQSALATMVVHLLVAKPRPTRPGRSI